MSSNAAAQAVALPPGPPAPAPAPGSTGAGSVPGYTQPSHDRGGMVGTATANSGRNKRQKMG